MAKARTGKGDEAADAPKKPVEKTDDPKKPNRSGVALNTYIDPDIREAMDGYMDAHNATDEHHATVRSTVEAALKLYLKSKGHWPPKPTA